MIIHTLLGLGLGQSALAEPPEPDPVIQLNDRQTARALSLQLRGIVPTMSELMEIEAAGGVDATHLDQWLDSDEFQQQVMRHHQSLFWNATIGNDLERQRLLFTSSSLYHRKYTSQFSRGIKRVSCSDWQNTDINQWNQPQTTQTGSTVLNGIEESFIDEGWVWVTPYWDMDTEIKVCAFDAQTNIYSASGTDCRTEDANTDYDCGCGPNLQWCMTRNIQTIFKAAFAEEVTERVRQIITNEQPYTELFAAKNMMFKQLRSPVGALKP